MLKTHQKNQPREKKSLKAASSLLTQITPKMIAIHDFAYFLDKINGIPKIDFAYTALFSMLSVSPRLYENP